MSTRDLLRRTVRYKIASDWWDRVKHRHIDNPERRSAQKAKFRAAKRFETERRKHGLTLGGAP